MPHCHCERSEESFSDPSQTLRMTQPDVYNYPPLIRPLRVHLPPRGKAFLFYQTGKAINYFLL